MHENGRITPQTIMEWEKVVNDTIEKAKYTYKKRRNYKKFVKIWKQWLGSK